MTLSEFLQNAALANSTRTALKYQEKEWSYAELQEQSLSVAAGLSSWGVNAGDRVAVFSKNCPEFIFTVFALSHLGATAVPINFLLKPEEVRYILNDISARHLITNVVHLETIIETERIYPGLKEAWVIGLEAADGIHKPFTNLYTIPHGAPPACKAEDPMLILYTSGTTGVPKGAMLSHSNLLSNARASAQALEIKISDRFLILLPLFHVFAWTTNVLVPLCEGASMIMAESIRPPKPWLKLMMKERVTCFTAMPQIYAVLAEQAKGFKKWVLRWGFFRTVRMCISGSAPLTKDTMDRFKNNIGIPIQEGYGLTETSPVTNCNTASRWKPGSVGPAIPGVKIKIIDENEKELLVNSEGEICISGPGVMLGYFNQPEATKAAFTADGWFKTGDVGLQDAEGFLYIRDRIKDMIIVKGLKVFSAQVEAIIITHPAVLEAAVVGIPDASGDEYVKGFIVLKEGAPADKQDILNFCKDKLPPYKRPRDLEFRKELPKNALQKVLKRQLRLESMAPK